MRPPSVFPAGILGPVSAIRVALIYGSTDDNLARFDRVLSAADPSTVSSWRSAAHVWLDSPSKFPPRRSDVGPEVYEGAPFRSRLPVGSQSGRFAVLIGTAMLHRYGGSGGRSSGPRRYSR